VMISEERDPPSELLRRGGIAEEPGTRSEIGAHIACVKYPPRSARCEVALFHRHLIVSRPHLYVLDEDLVVILIRVELNACFNLFPG